MRRLSPRRGDTGVALVAVLWFTVAIAGLAATFATLARGEALRSRNMVEAIRARAVLEAGLERAALELVVPTVRPLPRGIELEWPFDGAVVHMAITGQSGRLDLNTAGPALLRALATEVGADRELSVRIADAVVDWRDDNSLRRPKGAEDRDYRSAGRDSGAADAPFEHVAELKQLLPVEPAIYRKLRDLVTVTTGRATPDTELADPRVRRAMLGKDALEKDEGRGTLSEPHEDEQGTGDAGPAFGDTGLDDENAGDEDAAQDGGPRLSREDEADRRTDTGFTDPAGLYAVRLDARLASGYRAHADAVIWWQETPDGRPFRVLDWDPSPWRAAEEID